ncbi:Uncharacterized membrane protein [Limimonas halophila]|uniref:Uncharacterized membrane protein n=1 Tax=Limimonas halophila TaxID=1082479 RepID=A0A1G7LI68_9PROT|nr:DUF2189 domain-containing protein [Limimonas halophila]SDF49044.1 Uncharacterized membrane protein [Limimonas halophila]
MSTENAARAAPAAAERPAVRKLSIADLRDALTRGVNDFNARPTHIPFLCVIYPIVALIAGRAYAGYDFLPLIFPIIAGFALLGPVVAIGLYELSYRHERNEAMTWRDALSVVHSPAIRSIVILAAILLAIFLIWLAVAWAIYALTLGVAPPESLGAFVNAVFTTPAGWTLIGVGNLVGLVFAVGVLTISVVSFPMLLDRNPGVGAAVATSVRVVLANPVPMAVWGLIVVASLIGGAIPALIGLAVAMPVLGHATWHLYRKAVA